jgi:hypothetical protein
VGVVIDVSPHLIFVADLIACRLDFFMSAASNSKAVEWDLCVAALTGVCCS